MGIDQIGKQGFPGEKNFFSPGNPKPEICDIFAGD